MDVRTRPRQQAPAPTAARAMAGLVWQRIVGSLGLAQSQEDKEQVAAERADRLVRFLKGEPVAKVWELDLYPLLCQCWEETLRKVRAKEVDPDALGSLELFLTGLDNTLTFGAGAMERLAQRRLTSVAAAEVSRQRDTTQKTA